MVRNNFISLLFGLGAVVSAQNNYSLKQTLQYAQTNNPVLKVEHLNIGIAGTDLVSAKLRPNPIINNQSLHLMDPGLFPMNTTWGNYKNTQLWVQLTKQFVLPSQRRNKIELAQNTIVLSEKQYSETERQVYHDVSLKWLNVWLSKKHLDILKQAKANIDSLVVFNSTRLQNKLIQPSELSKAELLGIQYTLKLKTAEQNYEIELSLLKLAIGIQGKIEIDTTDQFQFALPLSMDSLLQKAWNLRSDLQVLRSHIDASCTNIKLQRSLALPVPELGAIYNPQNTVPYMGIYAAIQIPLFSRNQGEIKRSSLLKLKAEQGLNAAQLQIQTEIATAYTTYQTQQQNLQLFNTLIKESNDILKGTMEAYRKGQATLNDISEEQGSWLDIHWQYFEIQQQYRKSKIDLLFATGLITKLAE